MKIVPIPPHAGNVDGWEQVPIDGSSEPLVAIGQGTHYPLLTSAVYAGEHLHSPYRGDNVIQAASTTIAVRQSVAERLVHAESLLPDGLRLIVFDGYRSVEVQQALFDQFLEALRLQHSAMNDSDLVTETEKYVALPSHDATKPSPHSTGGAVDVAIISDNAMIEFGTPFDHGSERSALRYFEDASQVLTQKDSEARDNRRLLYAVMHAAGFEGYQHEWWHYNAPETQMGARAAKLARSFFGHAQEGLARGAQHSESQFSAYGSSEEVIAQIDRISPVDQVV